MATMAQYKIGVLIDEKDCFHIVDRETFERESIDPSKPVEETLPPGYVAIPREKAREMIAAYNLVRAMQAKGLLKPRDQTGACQTPAESTH